VQERKRVSVNVSESVQANSVAEKLDWLVTMDVKNMAVGQVRYGFLCNERGGIIDDLTVARLGKVSSFSSSTLPAARLISLG
jgi:glycine cleavage system aminomethyltransferase T